MEKSQPPATETEARQAQAQQYVWRPGIRRTPWSAFLALIVMFSCSPAAAAVLVVSNGQIAPWIVQPSVLLSIISGIWNTAVLYVLLKGVNISWWRAALHGTTLEQLNRIWLSGTSAKSAIFSIRHVKRIGVASIFSTIATLSVGPLLQRASRPQLISLAQEVEMQLYLPDTLPTGFAGSVWDSNNPPVPGNTLLTGGFFLAMQAWAVAVPLSTLNSSGFWCNGTCEATVKGAGITDSCATSSTTVDMTKITSSGFPGFSTSFNRFEDSNGITYLQATSRYISSVDNTCTGTLVTETCDFRLSINTYPIMYQNNNLTLNSTTPILVQESSTDDDLPNASFGSPVGLLSGLNGFADIYLASNGTIFHDIDNLGQETYIALPSNSVSASFLNLTEQFSPGGLPCQFQWVSPTDYIKEALNEVAFNAALIAGYEKHLSDLKTFIALRTQPMVVYVSDFGYLGAAMFIHALAIFTVILTLYGFWQIGHETTLSPLQTGRALGSPILADGEEAGAGENLTKLITEVGKKEVKYGVVASDSNNEAGAEKLGITHPHLLVRHFRK